MTKKFDRIFFFHYLRLMAFDMYLSNGLFREKEQIQYHEDFILQMMHEDDYPGVKDLWENFYNGPEISPDTANQIVHELLEFKSEHQDHAQAKSINHTIDRLIMFFSKAYRKNSFIKCHSD